MSRPLAALLIVIVALLPLTGTVAVRETHAAPAGLTSLGNEPAYTVTDIGTLGGQYSTALALNDAGQVVGIASRADGVLSAYRWQNGSMLDLTPDELGGAQALLINDAGQIIGRNNNLGAVFLWQNGTRTPIDESALPRGMNNVGQTIWTNNFGEAFLRENGAMNPLPGLGGSTRYALSLNDRGQITGSASHPDGLSTAVIWQDGVVTDLDGEREVTPETQSVGFAINNAGQVAGTVGDVSFGGKPAVWQGGVRALLGTFGSLGARPAAINNVGQIVGETARPDQSGGSPGLIWQNGVAVALNDLIPADAGWNLLTAYGINNRGQIVGLGVRDGKQHGYLLTPVVSPLSIAPVAGGAVTASSPGPYTAGQQVTLTAQPAPGWSFLGWRAGASTGMSPLPASAGSTNPLTITLAADTRVIPVFGLAPAFGDVPAGAAATAITQLSARGIIRGCDAAATPPQFCPEERTLRSQMAALIVRAMPGWAGETWPNTFTDKGVVDDELWRRVATLQHYGVANGYNDCAAVGLTPPCYGPTDPVNRAQAISFVTRALVKKGYWQDQPVNAGLYGGALLGTGHEQDASTYWHYTRAKGGVPDYPEGDTFPTTQDAPRGWFARLLWTALEDTPAANP